jgi:hypothetical protein
MIGVPLEERGRRFCWRIEVGLVPFSSLSNKRAWQSRCRARGRRGGPWELLPSCFAYRASTAAGSEECAWCHCSGESTNTASAGITGLDGREISCAWSCCCHCRVGGVRECGTGHGSWEKGSFGILNVDLRFALTQPSVVSVVALGRVLCICICEPIHGFCTIIMQAWGTFYIILDA